MLWDKLNSVEKKLRTDNQLLWEEDLLNAGVERYWKEWDRVKDEGKPEQLLLESAVIHLTPFYQQWIDKVCEGPKNPEWLPPLLSIGAAKIADIKSNQSIKWSFARHK